MFFALSISLNACSHTIRKYGIEDRENMDMLIRHYIYDHFRQPESVEDLIKYVENVDIDEFYRQQYRFLVRNRRKLYITNNDSVTMLFYRRLNIAVETFTTPCDLDEERSGLRTRKLFFDLDGYCFYSEPLSEEIRYVYAIAQKDRGNVKFTNPYIAILEYTPEKGLIDICTGKAFDFKNSEHLSETGQFLENFCKQNSLSRVIFPINVDKSSQ